MNSKTVIIMLFGVLTITHQIESQQDTDKSSVVSENSQELLKELQKRPRSDVNHRPARQQRPQQSGFGGLLSGKYDDKLSAT